jgi:molybdopterin synthase sulfur carrier subunit
MKVRVQMFAIARQRAGRDAVDLQLPDGARVADLRRALAVEVPDLGSILPHAMFAVNLEYADDDAAIPIDAAVACIPPVSGG